MTQSCKTCAHLDVKPDAAGRITVRNGNAYACKVEVPMPALPECMTHKYSFHWPLGRQFMCGHNGATCPTYTPRVKS